MITVARSVHEVLETEILALIWNYDVLKTRVRVTSYYLKSYMYLTRPSLATFPVHKPWNDILSLHQARRAIRRLSTV